MTGVRVVRCVVVVLWTTIPPHIVAVLRVATPLHFYVCLSTTILHSLPVFNVKIVYLDENERLCAV